MGIENFQDLIEEIKKARADLGDNLDARDGRFVKRFEEIEFNLNKLFRQNGRPGRESCYDDASDSKAAVDYCVLKHDIEHPTAAGEMPAWQPGYDAIEAAKHARKALSRLFRTGNVERLDDIERKSLTSFSLASNQFILTPQLSNRVLSCLVDPSDIVGLMGQETTSTGSLKFLIDNVRMKDAGWACEASCFANNPQPDLQDGLGELEIKAETIRYILCAGNDLLADAAFNIEQWVIRKAETAFRNTLNNAVIAGDGVGKPQGLLHPGSGIQICETSPATPAGTFMWQDLFVLAYEVPMQYHSGAVYLMNQRVFSQLGSMSDAVGRPLFGPLPSGRPGLQFAGFPIVIANQMPDVVPGACPVIFGNFKEAYTVVTRSGLTMRPDPYSAGFCTLFRFEARVGGNTTCPNAARFLRIH